MSTCPNASHTVELYTRVDDNMNLGRRDSGKDTRGGNHARMKGRQMEWKDRR